jgi:hypothetical protein
MRCQTTRREFIRRAAAVACTAAIPGPVGGSQGSAVAASVWGGAAPFGLVQAGGGRWYPRAPLPFPRTEVGVAEFGGKVYVMGGYAFDRVDQPFNQEYDPRADRCRDLAPMPRGLNHVGVVGFNGRIYMFGGFVEQNRNPVADA